MKSKRWILWIVLVIALLTLAGCGVPPEGVQDLSVTQPSGPWQSFVVWPLARALVWLGALLQGWGVPWHWGFAIILFTFLIKIITLPLTISQIRGMNAQRALQPKIQELQKKYGNDRNKISQEQMRLYQEAGVNPLSGCLPLIIQMPILFGLYAALVAIGPYLQDAAFIWIPDLAFPTARHGMGWLTEAFSAGTAIYEPTGIGGYATLVAYLVLPLLLMVTQFIMQKYMTPTAPSADAQVKTTQQITLIMTFMFGFFTLQVPAGLTLYWVTSNLLQMGQTWFMMRTMPAPALAPAVVDSTASMVEEKSPATKSGANKQSGSKQGNKQNTKALPAPASTKRTNKPVTEKATTVTASSAKAKSTPAAANTTTLKTTTLKTSVSPADLSGGTSSSDTPNAPEGKGATS